MSYGTGRVFQPKRRDGTLKSSRWWIAYYVRGREVRTAAGKTEGEARRVLKARLRELAGNDLIDPEQERMTVKELLDAYEGHLVDQGKKSPDTTRAHAKPVHRAFDDFRALAIRTGHLERYRQDRRDAGRAKQTIDKELGTLRAAYRLAKRREQLFRIPHVPMFGKSGENVRQGFLEPERFEAFVANFPEWLAEVIRFAYLTGWRRGEIVGLRWENVDRDAVEIRLSDSKNSDGRTLPLEGELAELIERCWHRRRFSGPGSVAEPWVFLHEGRRIGDFRKTWAAGCKAAETPKLLFHDLRRSAVRNLVRSGVPQSVAMRITGHRTASVFNRYDISSQDDKRDALRSVQAHIAAAKGGARP